QPRQPRLLDRRPPALQAGEQDAGARTRVRAVPGTARVPREPQMSIATAPTPERTERLEHIWEERPGVLGWLTTVDHKRIGLLYLFASLGFFAAGGVEALLIRTQLGRPNAHVVSPETFDQLFTLHGVTMIFLFVIPLSIG